MNITDEMKVKAKTVMKVTYVDGNTVPFFGLGKNRLGEYSLALEIKRHKNNVAKRVDRVEEAVIYKNHYPNRVEPSKTDVIMKFQNGVWM